MDQKLRSYSRYAATVAALFSVLLQVLLVVQAAGMRSAQGAPAGDPDALTWLAEIGAPICHSVQPAGGDAPDHAPKPVHPCVICAGLHSGAPLVCSHISIAFEPLETAVVFEGERPASSREEQRSAFEARGPPARVA